MQSFRTELLKKSLDFDILHTDHLFLIGSCFADNIAQKLQWHKLSVQTNPFGIIYNPTSIVQLLARVRDTSYFQDADIDVHKGRYFSWEAHSSVGGQSRSSCLNNLNMAVDKASKNLKKASKVFITLGTAWVYRHIEREEVVANCHKLPNTIFRKELLTMGDVKGHLGQMIRTVKAINPETHVIFTVSPIRHLKDGLIHNQWSKSLLHAAIHDTIREHDGASYFPSYELLLDDLRDYRFYKADLIHPNDQAIDYIWSYFCSSYFSEKTMALMSRIDRIQKRLAHRPFYPESDEHHGFLQSLREDLLQIQKEYDYMDWSTEIKAVNSALQKDT